MNTTTTFYYFAYGSNLKCTEIKRTCPTAKRRCRAVLPHYSLVFPRRSIGRSCGVASIERCADREVWGGIYTIPESERAALEEREGYVKNRPLSQNAYVPEKLTVFEDGNLSKPLEVVTFVANRQPNSPPPSSQYMNLITAGAREWNLDKTYIDDLEKIGTDQP